MQRILDSITAPAYVRNARLDILPANPLGAALYSPVFEDMSGTPNMARFVFLNSRARDFFVKWDSIAKDAVAILRAAAGSNPYDKRLSALGSRRRAVNAQRRVPRPLGRSQRHVSPHRREETAPPHRR